MIIQTLDFENNCHGAFFKNRFIFDRSDIDQSIQEASYSWTYSPVFAEHEKNMVFLSLYSDSGSFETLSSASADQLSQIRSYEQMIKAQKLAAVTAKVDIRKGCFFDLLPDHMMNKWFSCREDIIRESAKRLSAPSHYDILHKIHVITQEIARQKITFSDSERKIKYDIFSSSTGRLATKRGSFPILNISKEERRNLLPKNDVFLEIDLNGAEIRTLLSLSGQPQPNYDIHEFNREITKQSSKSRKEVKAKFFAWLYNPEAKDKNLEKFYDKRAYEKHYEHDRIKTPFGRELKTDERRALNYLTQSTTSDIVLNNCYNIMNLLRGKKSFVAFTMHDSVVLDFAQSEHHLVAPLKKEFEKNMFGEFLSTVSIGKNYGEMKRVKI